MYECELYDRHNTKNSSIKITQAEGVNAIVRTHACTHSSGTVSREPAKLTDSHVHQFCSRVYEL